MSSLRSMVEMKKISLYNCETGTVIEIEVPVAQAIRARDDIAFATELMNAALQESNSFSGESAERAFEEEIRHDTKVIGTEVAVQYSF